MDLFKEMERLTDPGVLRQVKVYSPEEIKQLVDEGKVQPIDQVHFRSQMPRVSVPDVPWKSSYEQFPR